LSDFVAFMLVGFLAQLVDGALGMGFGVISSSILLAHGVPPALASASVNAAKLPTTGTAALSHAYHRNINWNIARKLCLFGSAGGIIGALLLTSLKGAMLAYLVNAYLAFIGALIVYRGFMNYAPRLIPGERARTNTLARLIPSFTAISSGFTPLLRTVSPRQPSAAPLVPAPLYFPSALAFATPRAAAPALSPS
jgi:uncharacterized membrane protein YfcA